MSQLKKDRARLEARHKKNSTGTTGGYKSFSRTEHSKWDSVAAAAVITHLGRAGVYAVRNEHKTGPDIVVYRGFSPTGYIEAEVKTVWKPGQDFPWSAVQIPERKKKFCGLGIPVEFWVLRADLQVALVFSEKSLVESELVEVPNKYVPEGELFYKVPVSQCELITLARSTSCLSVTEAL